MNGEVLAVLIGGRFGIVGGTLSSLEDFLELIRSRVKTFGSPLERLGEALIGQSNFSLIFILIMEASLNFKMDRCGYSFSNDLFSHLEVVSRMCIACGN